MGHCLLLTKLSYPYTVWMTHKEARYALILEDDLTVGPDILDYFSQVGIPHLILKY